jgi:hypothetical protein
MPVTKRTSLEEQIKDAIQRFAPNMSSFNSYTEIDNQAILNDTDSILIQHIDEINKVPLSKLYDDIKIDITNDISFNANEYTDTQISATKDYIDTEITTTKDYVDTEITTTKDYIDTEITTTKDYVDTEITTAKNYTNTEITTTKDYIDTEITATKDYVDTEITTAKNYTNTEITSTRDYVDTEITSTRDYVDTEITSTRDYVDTEITTAKNYTNTEITSTRDYVDTEITSTRDYVDTEITSTRDYVDTEISTLQSSTNTTTDKIQNIFLPESITDIDNNPDYRLEIGYKKSVDEYNIYYDSYIMPNLQPTTGENIVPTNNLNDIINNIEITGNFLKIVNRNEYARSVEGSINYNLIGQNTTTAFSLSIILDDLDTDMNKQIFNLFGYKLFYNKTGNVKKLIYKTPITQTDTYTTTYNKIDNTNFTTAYNVKVLNNDGVDISSSRVSQLSLLVGKIDDLVYTFDKPVYVDIITWRLTLVDTEPADPSIIAALLFTDTSGLTYSRFISPGQIITNGSFLVFTFDVKQYNITEIKLRFNVSNGVYWGIDNESTLRVDNVNVSVDETFTNIINTTEDKEVILNNSQVIPSGSDILANQFFFIHKFQNPQLLITYGNITTILSANVPDGWNLNTDTSFSIGDEGLIFNNFGYKKNYGWNTTDIEAIRELSKQERIIKINDTTLLNNVYVNNKLYLPTHELSITNTGTLQLSRRTDNTLSTIATTADLSDVVRQEDVSSLEFTKSQITDYVEFDLGTKTTDELSEGTTNKYYTDNRVGSYLTANQYALKSDIPAEFDLGTKTTDELSEGTTNKYYTDNRVGSYLTANQYALKSDIPTNIVLETDLNNKLDDFTITENTNLKVDYEKIKQPTGTPIETSVILDPSDEPETSVTPLDNYTNGSLTHKVLIFTNDGNNETPYTINFPIERVCDILIIGGGGSGGYNSDGGGGAAELVFIKDCVLNGTYNIKVGKGGIGRSSYFGGTLGYNSSFDTIVSLRGGSCNSIGQKDGGSGAGAPAGSGVGGLAVIGTINNYNNGIVYRKATEGGNFAEGAGGGGGGAGVSPNTYSRTANGGDGLSGITEINYDFKENFGTSVGDFVSNENKVYFAGGGGAGGNLQTAIMVNTGGKGGGGTGYRRFSNTSPPTNGEHGLNNTGSGGGAGSGYYGTGGNGGAGIVIIRYSYYKTISVPSYLTGYLKYTELTGWKIDNAETYTDQDVSDYLTDNGYAKLTDISAPFDISTKTTDELSEGTTNKYYTDTRVGSYLSTNQYALKSDIPTEFNLGTKTTDELSEGTTNKYYTDTRVGSYLSTNQYALKSDIPTEFNLGTKTTDELSEGTTNKYYTESKVEEYLINNDYTTNSSVDIKLLNYELKNNVGTYNITIESIEFSGFYITANTREWNYNNEFANNLNYIGGDTLIINYNNIISSTSGDFYVEIYTDDENNPEVVINNGVASNNLSSITISATSGKTYRILTRRRTDNLIWYTTNLNVKLTIEYVNSRFINYALISDIPTEFNLSAKTTDDLNEGTTNIYYTDARVGSYLTANQYALKSDIPTAYTDTDVIGVLNENEYIRYIHLEQGLLLKANVNHTHEISDINNLSTELANINQYSDVKVDTFLTTKNYLTSIPAEYVNNTELNTAIGEINQYSDVKVDTFLTTKNYLTSIPAEYVTDTELSTAISGKADIGHTHTTADIIYLKDTTFHMDTTTTLLGENRFGICYYGNSGNGWSIIPINANVGGFLYNNGLKGSTAYSWQNITQYTNTDVINVLSQSAGDNLVWNSITNKFDATGGGSSQWTITGDDIYYNTGSVGIGTNIPDNNFILHVNGFSYFSHPVSISTDGNTSFWWKGNGVISLLGRNGEANVYNTSSGVGDLILRADQKLHLQSGVGLPSICIDTNNNVGIGKTDPSYKLDVVGTIKTTDLNIDNQIIFNDNSTLTTSTDIIKYQNLDSTSYSPTTTQTQCDLILYKDPNIDLVRGKIWVDAPLKFTQPEPPAGGIGQYTPPYISIDINTDTLELDTYGRLNVIGGGSSIDLPNYNGDINCANLQGNNLYASSLISAPTISGITMSATNISATNSLSVTSDATFIASFKHTNLTQGINIGFDRISAGGTNASQNISIVSKSTGSISFITDGITRGEFRGSDGTFRLRNTSWHGSYNDGKDRLYYGYNSTTYYRGHGYYAHTWRNGSDGTIANLYSNGFMWMLGGLTQYSDSRIKKNIEDIDYDEVLNKLLAIQPKTYNYINEKQLGTHRVYGFIAQQVKEVIPHAVKLTKEYEPNIYKECNCEENKIYVDIPNNIVLETEIKLLDNDDNHIECKIIENGEGYIKVDKSLDTNTIFVYGYKIDDLHMLTKEYIFTLNVCATQALSRKIDEQKVIITRQQEEINELKTKLNSILAHLGL